MILIWFLIASDDLILNLIIVGRDLYAKLSRSALPRTAERIAITLVLCSAE